MRDTMVKWLVQSNNAFHSQSNRVQARGKDSIHGCSNGEQSSVDRFAKLLHKCKEEKSRGNAQQLLASIREAGLERHRSLGNNLVSTLAELGSLHDAHQIFDNLVHRNSRSWNSLISGYVKHGRPKQALALYHTMPKEDSLHLNVYTFVALINACAKLKDLEQGLCLHAEVDKFGWINRDPFIGSSLVYMYAKCGTLDKAQDVFDTLDSRDVVSWNSLITGYVGQGQGEEALQCFEKMQVAGVFPNAITYSCVLKACGNISATEKGREVHAEVERRGFLEKDIVLATALVDMYAKCGFVSRAQEMFDKLVVRDVISWNSLIAGYATHGNGEEALKCFEHMQIEGVSPNSVTFICSLKACGSTGEIGKGEAIHNEIKRNTLLEKDIPLGTSLIGMYAQCGLLEKAQETFGELPVRNIVSWNTLISGFITHGYGEEALEFFHQMQFEGASPNSVTYICALKACTIIGAVDEGQKIHAEIDRKGLLHTDISVGTSLVDMYVKFGLLTKAQDVFDSLPIKNVVSWNSLIAGYVEHKLGEQALQCFEKMQSEGITPDIVTYVCALRACGSIGAIEKGISIHIEAGRRGLLERGLNISSALVDMYGKCGLFDQAQEVFDKLPVRDLMAWNSLICAYTEHRHGEEALELFERMKLEGIKPDSQTFIYSLKACGSIRATDNGRKIHQEIDRRGLLEEDIVLGTALVDMYTKCGLLAKAKDVFEMLPARSVILWNALIVGYIDHGYGEEAVECFKQMQWEGVTPDVVTYVCSLRACGSIGAIDKGQEIHEEIDRNGFLDRDLLIGTALVDMYLKCGSLNSARQVFDKIIVRDIVSWNSLIGGYAEHGHGDDALECFEKMQLQGIMPNAVTLSFILKACSTVGATEKGQEIHAEIERRGFLERDIVIGSSLVEMYSKCGMQAIASKVFEKLPIRDVVSWNSLIAGYAQAGKIESIFSIFDRMSGEGIKPDPFTFIIIFNACNRAGLFEQSETYFNAMKKIYGIIPMVEHHNCMINFLCRSSQLDKAVAMINKTPFFSNLVAWHAVLGACKNSGNVTLGKQAFENAVSLDEKDCASYVLMSQIYLGAGIYETNDDISIGSS